MPSENGASTGASGPRWAWWALAAFAALCLFAATYRQSRPEAALDLELGRGEALERARTFLEEQGFDLGACRSAISFETDSQTQGFLEKVLRRAEANRLMASEVSTWYWYVRFFVPLQEEEWAVALGPSGRLVYYSHHLPDATAVPSLDAAAAQSLAESFLAEHTAITLGAYKLVESNQEEKPNRVDHHFVWEREDFSPGGATYRVSVEVAGNAVSLENEYLKIPEDWQRGQRAQAARRGLLLQMASLLEYALWFAAVAVLYLGLRSRKLHFRPVLRLAALMALIPALLWLNGLPSSWLHYDPADTVRVFYGKRLLGLVQEVLNSPMIVLLFTAPAITLASEVFPAHPPLERLFTKRFWVSRGVFTAAFIGLCLATFHCAYYNLFYLIAGPLGVWSPQSTPFIDALGSPMPWVYPLATGFTAAVDEELLFRLFAISLLLKITRRPWLALLLPALTWGFLHSNYPQEPIYTRGVELTLVGLFYGLVFLRYGVLATVLSHFTYNAVAAGAFLLQSGNLYFALSGVIVVGLAGAPLIPGLLRKARGRPLEDLAAPAALAPIPHLPPLGGPASAAEDVPRVKYTTLSPAVLLLLAGLAALGLLACALLPLHTGHGAHVHVRVDRHTAANTAAEWLAERGVPVAEYRYVTQFYSSLDGDDADYVWQHEGVEGLERLFGDRFTSRPKWYIRFFKPGEKEGYGVSVDTSGSVRYYLHWLPETAPGPQLSQEQAREIAARYMLDAQQIDVAGYKEVAAQTRERTARNDHTFVWEDPNGGVGEARVRFSVSVNGDDPMGGEGYLHLPAAWERARSETRIRDLILYGGALSFGGLLTMLLLLLAHRLIAGHLVSFRAAWWLALPAPIADLVDSCNNLPLFWASYATTGDPFVFASQRTLSWFVLSPIGAYLAALLAIALAEAVYRHAFPDRPPLAAWFGFGELPARNRLVCRRAWGEALLIACAIGLAGLGLGRLFEQGAVFDATPPENVSVHDHAPSASFYGGYETALPAVAALTDALDAGMGGFILILVGSIFFRYIRRLRYLIPLFLPLAAAAALTENNGWGDMVGTFFGTAAAAILAVVFFRFLGRHIFRHNVPAILVTSALLSLPTQGFNLLATPNAPAQWNGIAVWCVITALAGLGIGLYRSGESDAASSPYESAQA